MSATATSPAAASPSADPNPLPGLGGVASGLLAPATSTPGKLRSRSLAIVVLAIITGLLASFMMNQRKNTVDDIKNESEPLIVAARTIQADLAEADAAASNAFLAGGIENAGQRARYNAALERVSLRLTEAARLSAGDEQSQSDIAAMQQAVTDYAGLIETARVNNRQGFPIGEAYLNTGSALLTDTVYPLTDDVANRSAERYRSDYNSLMSTSFILVAIVFVLAVALLVVLVSTQFFIRKRFNRLINAPLALATLLTVGFIAWMGIALASQGASLQEARLDGYEGVRDYVDARALGWRAKGAESRFLIARGGGDASEFDAVAVRLAGADDSLLTRIEDSADSRAESGQAGQVRAEWQGYQSSHNAILEADPEEAQRLALGEANESFDEFIAAVDDGLSTNQSQFADAMSSARSAVSGITIAALVLGLAIALLSLAGIQQRINEYR